MLRERNTPILRLLCVLRYVEQKQKKWEAEETESGWVQEEARDREQHLLSLLPVRKWTRSGARAVGGHTDEVRMLWTPCRRWKPGFIENPELAKEKKDLRNIKKTIDFYKQFNSMTSNWCPANWVLIRKSLNSGNFYNRKITFCPHIFKCPIGLMGNNFLLNQ